MRPRPNAVVAPETVLFLALGAVAVAVMAGGASARPDQAWVGVLALAVALTGLPHGALDPWVAWRAGLWRRRGGFVAFNLAYVALAACVVVAWWRAPGVSLGLFLAISAWHFAGDWRHDLPVWARAVAGAALLALPAWGWPVQVQASFALLAGPEGTTIARWLGLAAPWLSLGMMAAAGMALRRSATAALELVAVSALALLLPPLVYFIVYFCGLHSLRHLRLAVHGVDARSRRRMAAVALFYTALTLVAAGLAWPWLASAAAPAAAPSADLLRLVFIGLAALTLPHMAVVMLSEHRQQTAP